MAAERAIKKRKTEHVSSSDEDDDASFASFGDDVSDEEMSGVEEEAQSGAGKSEEEGEEEGEEDEEEEEAKATVKAVEKGKKKTTAHTSKPAAAQLASSAYASGTFKSNVFKLQVDQLLDQIRTKHGKREKTAETALHQVKQSIEQIAAFGPALVADAERHLLKTKVAVPFPQPRPAADAQYKSAYAKPANINVVGSFALKTKTGSRSQEYLEIDMVVVMPGSIFEDKDYLNYRYFYKRAYYLASIAAGLKAAHKGDFSLQFQLHHGNPLKPILVVAPLQAAGKDVAPAPKWRINIIPCALPDQFSTDKLKLDKNCVRNVEQESTSATPFYNSSLRSDMLMTTYLKLLHGASKSCESFIDACLLGSTWLRQRAFASSAESGGFGNFEWNALMALCLQGGGPGGKPLLSSGYSSYQLFKATLQLLAMKDFIKHPLNIGTSDTPKALDGTPVVWDTTRTHNLLYKVSQSSYRLLRNEAKSTLIALGDQLHDGFDATFILRVSEPLYRFDYTIGLPERLVISAGEHHDHRSNQHLKRLYEVLKQGLGDRVTQISISHPPLDFWALGSSRPTPKGNISIHLIVNPDKVKRTVDHGPAAESKSEAASFRAFWGDKSELRRFKDGSILESLIWSTPAESGGQSVLEQIIGYLLNRHFSVPTMEDLTFSGDGFTKLLRGGTDTALFTPLMERYKQFENDIRELREMPLSIRQIMPSDSQLCSTSILPPGSSNLPIPANVTLQFEGSGRWPDDLIAIQRTKIAFLLMISGMLQSSHSGLTTRIGLENPTNPILNQAFLDVTYDLSATFRLRIYHDREQHLLSRTLADKTSSDPKTREIAAKGLAQYRRNFIVKPAQTQALIRLSTRFPALSGAIRLTKKWIASHYLSNHISEELVELLVVRTFTNPAPWGVPTTPHTGFLRTIAWIARWDWRTEPLIVDFSTERSEAMSEKTARSIRTNFEAWRKLDPGMNRVAVFAASSVDSEGTCFTDGRPAKVLAGRLSALARAACAEILSKGVGLEPRMLFGSDLTDFDFVITLKDASGGKRKGGKSSAMFKNLEMGDDVEMIGYDPVECFLEELEEVYGSAVLFFRGEGDVIAGLWSPETERRGWRVNLAFSTVPVKAQKEGQVEAVGNREGMLAEMGRLGGDLVQRVELLRKE